MSRYIDIDEVNNIVGGALENIKDELSPSFYKGAKTILDKINEMAEPKEKDQ